MSLCKLKDKLRHYKSLENLFTIQHESSLDKKRNKKPNNENSKICRSGKSGKKHVESRLATEVNDKVTCTREELKKYAKIFKNEANIVKHQSKPKSGQTNKLNRLLTTQSTKKVQRNKKLSPVVSKFMPRKQITEIGSMIKPTKIQKKHLKKGKKTQQNGKFNQKQEYVSSIFNEKEQKQQKGAKIQRSKKPLSLGKSKSKQKNIKMQKINSQMSLDSTPSCTMTQQIQLLSVVGEGTFGKVFMGRMKKTGQIIAIKRVLQDSRYKNRQIQIVKLLSNEFVMQVKGSYITYQSGLQYLNIMMKYYQQNLYSRIKNINQMSPLDTKIIIYQIFKGLSYLHSLNICHRDIKPENILLRGNSAVICDFGSAKILSPLENNISYICARCYRAPQLIFGSTKYFTIVDIWSAGCVILQILNGDPLFIGDTSISHLLQIVKILGTPSEQEVISMNPDYDLKQYKFPKMKKKNWTDIFPDADKSLLNLINQVMVYSPKERIKAVEALSHQYFDELRDQITYQHIKSMYHLRDFFNFSEEQLIGFKYLRGKIIPSWYSKV